MARVANIWNDLTKWLDDASKVVGKEAGDLTLRGRLKLEIFELNRSLSQQYSILGSKVFDQAYLKKSDTWKKHKDIAAAVRKIKSMRRKLKEKEAEYKKVGKKSTKKRLKR